MKKKIYLLLVLNSILCFYIGFFYERNRIHKAINSIMTELESMDVINNELSKKSKQLEVLDFRKELRYAHLMQLQVMMSNINLHNYSAVREGCYILIIQDIIKLEGSEGFDYKFYKPLFLVIAGEMDAHPCKLKIPYYEKYKISFIKRTLPKDYPFLHYNP